MSIEKVNNRRGCTIWLTGLSGAGKTTLAERLAAELAERGRPPAVLDGDVVRTHLSKGLGFSREDRDTNIRRIAFVSSLVTHQGGVVIAAAISPYRDTRDEARALIGEFVEVYVECPLEELVRRDVKGLYAKALRGEIPNFTGVSDPYEPPRAPEVVVRTDRETVEESAAKVLAFLEAQGYVEGVRDQAAGDLTPWPPLPQGEGERLRQAGGGPGSRLHGSGDGERGRAAADGPAAPGAAHHTGPAAVGRAPTEWAAVPGVGDSVLSPQSPVLSRPALWGRLGEPHGGELRPRQAPPEVAAAWRERIQRDRLAALAITPREACDVELLGNGAFSPLSGFQGREDYRSVVRDLRLADGLLWSIPVVLGAAEAAAAQLREGQDVALLDDQGAPLAVLHLREKFLLSQADVRAEALEVYRTADEAHPGVRALYARGPVLLAGPVTVLQRPAGGWGPPGRGAEQGGAAAFEPYRLDPAATRRAFAARGWRTVVGFQTRNPVHRAHEYLLKTALESVDGLLLHPLVGETKDDDVPAEVRLRCYEALLAGYFPPERVLLAVLPAAMRYAGPREALFHALMRKNYGCTHFIVGRDHAGVGNYYGTYDAQRIFEGCSEEELGIRPVFFEHAFYCAACGGTASAKTCPHTADHHVALSGTTVRSLLAAGESLPPEFSRPEVARVLVEAVRSLTSELRGPGLRAS